MKESLNNTENKKINISKEDGIEVLENLEINEKNEEFTQKMAEIESEMKKRKAVLKLDKDTGEPLKQGKNEFSQLKEDTKKETREQLTRTSKYVKGAIIAGLVATGLFVDFAEYGPISQVLESSSNTIVNNVMFVTDVAAFVGAIGFGIRNSIKAISQEIKTRIASNEKVKRIIGMMAGGMNKEQAQKTVGMETRLYFKGGEYSDDLGTKKIRKVVNRGKTEMGHHVDRIPKHYGGYSAPEQFIENTTGSDKSGNSYSEAGKRYFGFNKEALETIRKELDEMGIKRVSREKYKG